MLKRKPTSSKLHWQLDHRSYKELLGTHFKQMNLFDDGEALNKILNGIRETVGVQLDVHLENKLKNENTSNTRHS